MCDELFDNDKRQGSVADSPSLVDVQVGLFILTIVAYVVLAVGTFSVMLAERKNYRYITTSKRTVRDYVVRAHGFPTGPCIGLE